jgi:hypothetical protein
MLLDNNQLENIISATANTPPTHIHGYGSMHNQTNPSHSEQQLRLATSQRSEVERETHPASALSAHFQNTQQVSHAYHSC